MKTYQFESQLWLPQARDPIFKFFADPRNLQRKKHGMASF